MTMSGGGLMTSVGLNPTTDVWEIPTFLASKDIVVRYLRLNPTTAVWEIPTLPGRLLCRPEQRGLNPTTDVWEIPTHYGIIQLTRLLTFTSQSHH